MTRALTIDSHVGRTPSNSNRVSSLQFGPCWCRGLPGDVDAFDFMRLRTTMAELPIEENLLLVSARVVDGAQRMVLQVYEEIPEPKLVIRGGVCLATSRFWDLLPGGWVPTNEILPVDIRVDDCVAGRPEALLVAFMTHMVGATGLGQEEQKTAMSVS